MASDPAVLDRIAAWDWQDGLLPGPAAPVWPMDAFRDRFLDAFTPHVRRAGAPAAAVNAVPGRARAFWLREPGAGEIRTVRLPEPGPDDVVVRALHSGISRGTETLVFRGEVPESQREAMRAPFQDGDFPGPVKYGYLSVGVVERGPADLARAHRLLPAPAPDGLRGAGGRRRARPGRRPGPARRARRHGRDRGQRAVGRPSAAR